MDGTEIAAHDRETDAVIAGAGPCGLMLAGDLAARGVRVIVLERAAAADGTPKGNGIIGRAALELQRLGLLDGTGLRVVQPAHFHFGDIQLRLGRGRGNPLHLLPIPQRRLEQLLEERAVANGARIDRGHEVTGFDQSDDTVTVIVAAPDGVQRVTAAFLVGCDGARSTVRKRMGVGFPGFTSDHVSRIARVTMPAGTVVQTADAVELPGIGRFAAMRPNRAPGGGFSIAPAAALDPTAPRDVYIVAAREPRADATSDGDLSAAELSASLARVLGAELPFTDATAIRATVGNSRHADAYRAGRVLLAGDAAHIFNAGGSAINSGLLDALDLAPRIAAVVAGNASVADLDAYEAARRPANDRTLAQTRLQAAIGREDEQGDALRTTLAPVLRGRAAARALARLVEGA